MKPVEIVNLVLLILEFITSIALAVVILCQNSKESGLSAISGNNDSYMGKGKTKSLDKKLASATKWIALVWLLVTLAFTLVSQLV